MSNPQQTTLREVARVSRAIRKKEAELAALYDERVELYEVGQGLDPKVSQPQLAAAAGCTEMAVQQAMAKRRRQRAQADAVVVTELV